MSIEAINPIQTIPRVDPVGIAPSSSQQEDGRTLPGEPQDGKDEEDSFAFSDTARKRAAELNGESAEQGLSGANPQDDEAEASTDVSAAPETEDPSVDPAGKKSSNKVEEQQEEAQQKADEEQVQKLRDRDLEVRTHEAAHLAAAGSYAQGGAHFDYQTGPDGKRYAVGGHVDIDISVVKGDPQATIQKAEQVRRAALAPAEPSAKDRQVASRATSLISQAQATLTQERIAPNRAEHEADGDKISDKADAPTLEKEDATSTRSQGPASLDTAYTRSGRPHATSITSGLSLIA